MTKQFKTVKKEDWQLLVQCPTTCQEVVAEEQNQYPIPGGQIIWWHCPACRGWHLIVEDKKVSAR